jgi:hypothetical protein
MAEEKTILDLSAGLYRRIYGGFITGKRINSVSMECEAFFWRLHAVVDDFGNFHGDAALIRSGTQGRREFTVKQIERWVDELVCAKLAVTYRSGGEVYIHVLDFEVRQPAGRNGRRIKRFPTQDEADSESGGIRGNPEAPGKSKRSENDSHYENDSERKKAAPSCPEPDTPASGPAALLVFPAVGRGSHSWNLTSECVGELSEAYPGLDVMAECRKALAWCQGNPKKRKTASGMRAFLTNWLNRSTNRGGTNGNGHAMTAREARSREMHRFIDEEIHGGDDHA